MTTTRAPAVPLPIYQPSSKVQRYIIYDVETITWLRKEHNILGVLIGTLPQIPSQNMFMGLPLELQPEEARLLVEQGIAFVVDDLDRHRNELQNLDSGASLALRSRLQDESSRLSENIQKEKLEKKEKAIREAQSKLEKSTVGTQAESTAKDESSELDESKLLGHERTTAMERVPQTSSTPLWTITPASSLAMTASPEQSSGIVPEVNAPAFALFKHLHHLGYFMTPGLRFGCRFSVYPGDPLRYHSHFLANGMDWDEEVDLIDLVGGGRLGTGVKKAWLVGGPHYSDSDVDDTHQTGDSSVKGVRTFCIEWGGM